MAKCKFTIKCDDRALCNISELQNFPVAGLFESALYSSLVNIRTITVELVSVKRKSKQQSKRINCIPGALLKVTSDPDKAEESFGVVGCKAEMGMSHKQYLGEIGCVARFDNFVVELRHADSTLVCWGYGALSTLLTSDEVEGMKVRNLSSISFFTHMYINYINQMSALSSGVLVFDSFLETGNHRDRNQS